MAHNVKQQTHTLDKQQTPQHETQQNMNNRKWNEENTNAKPASRETTENINQINTRTMNTYTEKNMKNNKTQYYEECINKTQNTITTNISRTNA